ncbi:MAG: thioesterase family protein [Myxococcota bacterium]
MREHRHRLRVIYGDTDMMGVVYYANYFRYFEAGRNELLRAAGLEYRAFESMGYMLPVTDATAKYHASARYDDVLDLTTSVERVRRGSLIMTYRLEREDPEGVTLIATGATTHACLDGRGRVARFPDVFREALAEKP